MTHLATILTDLGISIDDFIVNRITLVHSHVDGYMGRGEDRNAMEIFISVPLLFRNPLMSFKPIARRFILFTLVKHLYAYWSHVGKIDCNTEWAESYAEDWVRKNA